MAFGLSALISSITAWARPTSTSAAEMSSESADPKDARLTIRFAYQTGLMPELTSFVVKKTTPFLKIITAWCDKHNRKKPAFRFMFDGDKINDEDT